MKGLNIMGFLTLLLIAVGLSMDAFAVSVSSGMALCFTKMRQNLRIAGSFGLFQGIMPLLGYAVANTFSDKFEAIDHWIAFGLLGFVGGKMLWEAWRGGEDIPSGDLSSWRSVMLMSVATSIDALAVGASFAVMPHEGILARAGYLLCAAIIAVKIRTVLRGRYSGLPFLQSLRQQGGNCGRRGAYRYRN